MPGFVARVVLRNIMAREYSQNLRLSYSVNNSYPLMIIRLFSKSFFMFNNTLNRYVYVSVSLAYKWGSICASLFAAYNILFVIMKITDSC